MKETIWRYLEQYDLPVVVAPNVGNTGHTMETQVLGIYACIHHDCDYVLAIFSLNPCTYPFISLALLSHR